MTDRELAYLAYRYNGIPQADWPEHFDCDSCRGKRQKRGNELNPQAADAYRRIIGSLQWWLS